MVGKGGLIYSSEIGRPWTLFDDWKNIVRPPSLPLPTFSRFSASGQTAAQS
jgi:hypothetical protein